MYLPKSTVNFISSDLPYKLFCRGKVRDVYDLQDKLLIISSDRISAFDVILPTPIPNKGKILNQLSVFWFNKTKHFAENHLITSSVEEYPEEIQKYKDILEDRSSLVKKAKKVPLECIVRGYISGSAWKDYKKNQNICGINLPEELKEGDKLPAPIFTPSTKAETGHDENISHSVAREIVGDKTFEILLKKSLEIYKFAYEYAEKRGIIIADTKLEFGYLDEKIILIDELLTPDSSRFWDKAQYFPGKPPGGLDKQFVRDYLETLSWDKTPPGPDLPPEIVERVYQRYEEVYKRLVI